MSVKRTGLTLLCLLLPFSAAIAEETDQGVLARWGDVVVTNEDMRRYLAFYLPEEDHKKALAGNTDQYVRNMLMMRTLANRAREAGVGPDAEQLAWQKAYQEVTWLVQAYQQKEVSEAKEGVDWEALARETYIAEPERFRQPDQINAAHILINTEERSEEEAEALIKELRERALTEDFAALAREYSDDTASAQKGGGLGTFEARHMVPEFSAVAFAMSEPGEISEPVKTQFGYHIIRLNEKIPGEAHPFNRAKRHLVEELEKSAAKRTIDNLLGNLRAETLEAVYDYETINSLRAEYGLEAIAAPESQAGSSTAE